MWCDAEAVVLPVGVWSMFEMFHDCCADIVREITQLLFPCMVLASMKVGGLKVKKQYFSAFPLLLYLQNKIKKSTRTGVFCD